MFVFTKSTKSQTNQQKQQAAFVLGVGVRVKHMPKGIKILNNNDFMDLLQTCVYRSTKLAKP